MGGEIFCICPDWPWGPPSLLYKYWILFWNRGMALTTYSHLELRLRKKKSYTSVPPLGICDLFYGNIYLDFTLILELVRV
jgi:hypothetical protein